MDLIRIRLSKFSAAEQVAAAMGLTIDRVYGDTDKQYVSIGARHIGPMGNHEPRWTEEQRAEFRNWKL
jgi:hypothetical protein